MFEARPTSLPVLLLSMLALAVALPACGDSGGAADPYQADPDIGATEFVSAGVEFSAAGGGSPTADAGNEGTDQGGEAATVEEGDIYRLLKAGRLLNLNQYRGLQVLDVSDPTMPALLGQLRVAGSPVELYAVDDTVIVLLNSWNGYYATADAGTLEGAEGGVVLLVDVSDATHPMVLDTVVVGGNIRTSRLVTQGDQVALYVASEVWEVPEYDDLPGGGVVAVDVGVSTGGAYGSGNDTVIASYELTGGSLTERSTLNLGGGVSDIHATAEALLVARYDWNSEGGSQVAVIDISDPGGEMLEGADITVSGVVESQFNMDLRGDVLRVVSGGLWLEDGSNHVETWDVSDLADPQPLDLASFGEGEDLYATVFLEDRAFFVTYFVQDPFHAFEITPDGAIIEHAEFVVSGWNDFFVPALGATRLIGVGVDDADGARNLAVSLYDITDLDAPEPLIERAELELEWAWTEASWDHRAFSVVEDAVEIEGPDGVMETGLVLLPFSGWDEDGYVAGVQIFTFSGESVTARAAMDHASPVRRSFLAGEGICANISETSLSLYDATDPAVPVAQSTMELAPDRSELFVFGDHVVRVERTTEYYWYGGGATAPPWRAEVVGAGEDADTGAAVAVMDIRHGSDLWQVGDLLVAAQLAATAGDAGDSPWTTTIDVWDLGDPVAPDLAATFETLDLEPSYGGYGYGYGGVGGREPAADDCWDCGGYVYYGELNGLPVGEALVFRTSESEWETAGVMEVCETWYSGGGGSSGGGSSGSSGSAPPSTDAGVAVEPDEAPDEDGAEPEPAAGSDGKADDPDGTIYTGGISCVSLDGGTPMCVGQIFACDADWANCEPVDASTLSTYTDCWTSDYDRYWQHDSFQVLDLSDPAAPSLGETLATGSDEEAAGVVTDGKTLYHGFAQPFEVAGDDRPYLKYYVRPIDLTVPSAPVLGAAINVPGWPLLVDGDTIYTQDRVYNASVAESALSRLTLQEEVAVLEARHRFDERAVTGMVLDGAGHAVVVHTESWMASPYSYYGGYGDDVQMSVLDAQTLAVESTSEIASWAQLRGAVDGQALFQVSGGVLTIDISDPAAPTPRAFFATAWWPERFHVDGDDLLVAAGRYGIYTLDLTTTNLIAP